MNCFSNNVFNVDFLLEYCLVWFLDDKIADASYIQVASARVWSALLFIAMFFGCKKALISQGQVT